MDEPVIRIEGDDDAHARLYLSGNTGNAVYNYYTIETLFNPNCSELNGTIWTGRTLVWKTPYLDAVTEKTFHIKARGCSVFGEQTRVISYTKNLSNTAFNISFKPNHLAEDLSTDTKFEIDNKYVRSGDLLARYSINDAFIRRNIEDCNR